MPVQSEKPPAPADGTPKAAVGAFVRDADDESNHSAMTMIGPTPPSTWDAIVRGALGRCPRCGHGRLMHHYLKIVDRCSACGEPYGHIRADDAPPWLTILVVGHIMAPIILAFEVNFDLALWIDLAVWVPLTLALLPRCKGVILALLWTTKAEGSEAT
jgi:uncharacterized protein (DUF983 family)